MEAVHIRHEFDMNQMREVFYSNIPSDCTEDDEKLISTYVAIFNEFMKLITNVVNFFNPTVYDFPNVRLMPFLVLPKVLRMSILDPADRDDILVPYQETRKLIVIAAPQSEIIYPEYQKPRVMMAKALYNAFALSMFYCTNYSYGQNAIYANFGDNLIDMMEDFVMNVCEVDSSLYSKRFLDRYVAFMEDWYPVSEDIFAITWDHLQFINNTKEKQ